MSIRETAATIERKTTTERPTTTPGTVDAALRTLGVECRSTRRAVSRYLEIVVMPSQHRLLNRAERLDHLLVGVTGSFALCSPAVSMTYHGPFAIDAWVCDSAGRSTVEVVSASRVAVLLANWQYLTVVKEAVPYLTELSGATRTALCPEPIAGSALSEVELSEVDLAAGAR